MRMRRHFPELNNKGASLITVIITIGFIAILAGTIMMTSLVNFKMKRVNVYAKDTFYSAEQVLDEINIGLQRCISDSLSAAYMDVMQNYSQYSVEQKRMKMQTNYYENMWERLEADNNNKRYDVTVLEGFLKASTKWQGPDDAGYGAIVKSTQTDAHGNPRGVMETYDTGIVLKDLSVYYKDSKGFISVIKTDIRLTYPELDFTATTALPDIASHVIIADAGMEIVSNDLTIDGNFYADSVTGEGMVQNTKMKIVHTGDGRVVIKHNLELKNASFSNEEAGSLWAEDIHTNGASLTLNGETLVADDLNVDGDGSVITLSGIYNGFGSSISDPDGSSAILINGTNSSLDLSGLEKLTLAGHAYVGTGKDVAPENEATQGKSSSDVFTGESIAVKSNQLMYLIPPECIGVDSITGESLYNKNPLTSDEYNRIQEKINESGSTYTEVSLDVEVEKLNSTLTDYISKVNGAANPERVFVQTSEKPLVYYYMKFVDEEAANRYFALYYNSNKEEYDKYIKTYVDALKFPSSATVARVKLAANGVYGDRTDGFNLLAQTVQGASAQLEDNQLRYQQKFGALCTKLTDNYLELTDIPNGPDATSQILYENLVDEAALDAYIQAGGETTTLEVKGGSENGKAILTKGDYTVILPDVHLVIATGNVAVAVPNFEGTIFANGLVTVAGNVATMTTGKEEVSALLRCSQEMGGKNVMVAQVLRAGKEFVFANEDSGESEEEITSIADLIVYENWKKE